MFDNRFDTVSLKADIWKAVVHGKLQRPDFSAKITALAFAEAVFKGKREAEDIDKKLRVRVVEIDLNTKKVQEQADVEIEDFHVLCPNACEDAFEEAFGSFPKVDWRMDDTGLIAFGNVDGMQYQVVLLDQADKPL
jgi:hypothetical protein